MLSIARAGGGFATCLLAIAAFRATSTAAPALPDTAAVLSGPLTLERALALAGQYELRISRRSARGRRSCTDRGRRPSSEPDRERL